MYALNVFESAGISPADFKCITISFLRELVDHSFSVRAKLICENIINLKNCDKIEYYYKNSNLNATVLNFDDGLFLLDLTDGDEYAYYRDYVFGDCFIDNFASMFCSIVSAYVDAAYSCDELGGSFDLAFSGDEGLFPIAAYYAKKCGLPLGNVFVGLTDFEESEDKVFFERQVSEDEADNISLDVFDEFDLTVDPYTASAILAAEEGVEEKSNPLIIINFATPYLFSRRIFNNLFDLNELSPQKAIKRLYEETALPIPANILNGKIPPFFKLKPIVNYIDAIKTITSNK